MRRPLAGTAVLLILQLIRLSGSLLYRTFCFVFKRKWSCDEKKERRKSNSRDLFYEENKEFLIVFLQIKGRTFALRVMDFRRAALVSFPTQL